MPVEIHPEMAGLYGESAGFFRDFSVGGLRLLGALTILLPTYAAKEVWRAWRSTSSEVKWGALGGISLSTFLTGIDHSDPVRIAIGGLGTGLTAGYAIGRTHHPHPRNNTTS